MIGSQVPAGLHLVSVRSQALPAKCPAGEHLRLFTQSNCGAAHSSHSPPCASQIAAHKVPVLQAVPVALHCCKVRGGVPVQRYLFAVQVAGLQAFVVVLQPGAPQSTSSMKPV